MGRWFPLLVGLLLAPAFIHGGEPLSPSGLAVVGGAVWVTLHDAKRICLLSAVDGREQRVIELPGNPTGIAAHGSTVWVTLDQPTPWLLSIDGPSGRITSRIPAGHGACAPAVSDDGRVAVCARFDNRVLVYTSGVAREYPVSREPVCAVFSKDGRRLFVANLLPNTRADLDFVAAEVSCVDTQTGAVTPIRLPNGSTALRSLCLSPDGSRLYAVHNIARFMVPTTQVERGWMNTAALTLIDVKTSEAKASVLLDEPNRGAANPFAVACSEDGATLVVAHEGTRELSLIDLPALEKKVEASGDRGALTDDLRFLSASLRKRVGLTGQALRSLAVADGMAWTAGMLSDTVHRVNLGPGPREVMNTILAEPTLPSEARRGEQLFFDATICFQQWQSCGSCHPDGRVDGLNWDLLNDGIGNPKNVRNLFGVFGRSPVMSHGQRADAETAVRAGIRYILFAERPEAEARALSAFLKSMPQTPSPALVDGKPSDAALRGRALFETVGCRTCHSGPLYTDQRVHDVGTRSPKDKESEFLTPTLLEIWRTAPFFHDGRHATIQETMGAGNHFLPATFPKANLEELVEFLRSL